MSPLERLRQLYAWEIDSDHKMLTMIESVPDTNRADPRFQRAVNLAAHLAACRENFLDFMTGSGEKPVPWFETACALETLAPRFAALEAQWTDYLAKMTDADREGEFEIPGGDGKMYRLSTEVQILQLAFHTPYHRGQIALLVDMLGGETVDTDYVGWIYG